MKFSENSNGHREKAAFETLQTMLIAARHSYVARKSQGREMSRPRILVINPNSNVTVTKGLEDALKPLDFTDGPEIVCTTLAEGPYGIESQADVDSVAMPLAADRERQQRVSLRHRLLQRSRPACLPGGNRPAGVRHRRMRRVDRDDARRNLRRHR